MVQEATSVVTAPPQASVAARPAAPAVSPTPPDHTESPVRNTADGGQITLRATPAYAHLQAIKDSGQHAALADRQRLTQLDEAQRLLREMQKNLTAIVKNYPPFPIESADRQRYLEMVAGLRQQMEALIFPPPDKWGPPPLPGARSDWLPPALDLQASDASVGQALETVVAMEDKVAGFGSEIRAAWQNLPLPADAAYRLSEAVGRQLASLASGLGAGNVG